jgi:hypothetical protein
MSSWNDLLEEAKPAEHVVQLYGHNDQLLIRNTTTYLLEGLRRGDGLIVIATQQHRDALVRSLGEASSGVAEARSGGRLVLLDAQATLDRFLVHGVPNQAAFQEVVGGAVREVLAHSLTGKVRAFGEMVALLWSVGQRAAAIRLEELWNDLLAGSGVSLFCAYPIDLFDAPQSEGLDTVLRLHTHAYAGRSTMLSSGRASY